MEFDLIKRLNDGSLLIDEPTTNEVKRILFFDEFKEPVDDFDDATLTTQAEKPIEISEDCTMKMLVKVQPIGDWYDEQHLAYVECTETGFKAQAVEDFAEDAVQESVELVLRLKEARQNWIKSFTGAKMNLGYVSSIKSLFTDRQHQLIQGYKITKDEFVELYQLGAKLFDENFEIKHSFSFDLTKNRYIFETDSIYDIVYTRDLLAERVEQEQTNFFDYKVPSYDLEYEETDYKQFATNKW